MNLILCPVREALKHTAKSRPRIAAGSTKAEQRFWTLTIAGDTLEFSPTRRLKGLW